MGGLNVKILVAAKGLDGIRAFRSDRDQINATSRTARSRCDHVVQHQMTPTIPANVLAAERSASGGSGEFLTAMCPHQALFGVALVCYVVGECAVSRVKISIVIAVVRACVD